MELIRQQGDSFVERQNKRATRAVIHLENISHNLDSIRRLTGGDRKICVAVKADAYGHGAVAVSRRALEWGVDFLAVSNVDEGIQLRDAGITAPVILFGFPLDEEIPDLVKNYITPLVGDELYVEKLNREALKQGRSLNVHLKIDTGMGRIGVLPAGAPALAEMICARENLLLEGTCTHFPVSDSPDEADIRFTRDQIKLFNDTVQAVREKGIDPGIVHAANSGAIVSWPEAHFDMVRAGICFYGYYPDPALKKSVDFKPVMELVSRVSFMKKVKKGTSISYGRTWQAPEDSWIATVPVGYADGYNRLLSSRGEVLISGKRYPVAGRICMDQLMVNLGPDTDVKLFDPVVLFGPEEGALSAADVAALTGTISYEVTCLITRRVPRDYTV